MSIINLGFSAFGRLAALAVLAGAFFFGLAGVVYMSLQGEEIKVPEITGKGLSEGEHELASLGLKIKKRADRFSTEKPNTVIEQLPKPGETVKTGQLILVVTSKGPGEGDQPASLKNTSEQDDSEKIEEMISDKPKKPKSNSNSNRKKADTARDVASNNSDEKSSSNSNSSDSNSNKKDPGSEKNSTEKSNKTSQPAGEVKTKPPTAKSPGGDPRPKPPAKP